MLLSAAITGTASGSLTEPTDYSLPKAGTPQNKNPSSKCIMKLRVPECIVSRLYLDASCWSS